MSETQRFCVEVVHSPPTARHLASATDPELVRPAMEILTSTPGYLKGYGGLSVEDKQIYGFNVWKNVQAQRDFLNDSERYSRLRSTVKNFPETPPTIIDISDVSDIYATLGAPVVEFAYFTLKPGHSLKRLEELIVGVDTVMKGLEEKYGWVGGLYGPVVETENTFGVIIGWTSVDAHRNAVRTVPELIELTGEIAEHSEGFMRHVESVEWKS